MRNEAKCKECGRDTSTYHKFDCRQNPHVFTAKRPPSIIDEVVRQVKGESGGWSVSQKEAIRERLIELCVTAIDLYEEIADSTEATEAEINKVLEALEAITKGEEQ